MRNKTRAHCPLKIKAAPLSQAYHSGTGPEALRLCAYSTSSMGRACLYPPPSSDTGSRRSLYITPFGGMGIRTWASIHQYNYSRVGWPDVPFETGQYPSFLSHLKGYIWPAYSRGWLCPAEGYHPGGPEWVTSRTHFVVHSSAPEWGCSCREEGVSSSVWTIQRGWPSIPRCWYYILYFSYHVLERCFPAGASWRGEKLGRVGRGKARAQSMFFSSVRAFCLLLDPLWGFLEYLLAPAGMHDLHALKVLCDDG